MWFYRILRNENSDMSYQNYRVTSKINEMLRWHSLRF